MPRLVAAMVDEFLLPADVDEACVILAAAYSGLEPDVAFDVILDEFVSGDCDAADNDDDGGARGTVASSVLESGWTCKAVVAIEPVPDTAEESECTSSLVVPDPVTLAFDVFEARR